MQRNGNPLFVCLFVFSIEVSLPLAFSPLSLFTHGLFLHYIFGTEWLASLEVARGGLS